MSGSPNVPPETQIRLRLSGPTYALLVFAFASILVSFAPALSEIYDIWNLRPEYSYGIIIPALSLFLIWRNRAQLRGLRLKGSWYGLILVAAGLALRVVGEFSTMNTVQRYAFLLVLYGMVLTLTGPVIFRRLSMPLAVLIFMVPLPMFLTDGLSLDLQLLSSVLGVWVIRAAGVSVFLQGNIIDLGTSQLEVAEACSGLRYLFPLMTLSFLIGFLFRGALWKRGLIFLSSVPITVVMNSLRVGVIGITVDRWGQAMAEGTLHEFEGWLVFMFSLAAVMLVSFGLAKIGNPRIRWGEVFQAADAPVPATIAAGTPSGPPATGVRSSAGPVVLQKVPRPFIVATIMLAVGALADRAVPERHETIPARSDFAEFPSQVGGWVGHRAAMDSVYLDALHLDDYMLADFQEHAGNPINFYVAYYQSQRSGHRVHSPINCIPGGGWKISKLEQRRLPGGSKTAASLPVNRAVIEMGSQKNLVYYWFQERGRQLTSENLVKWYIFWDALTRNRTDGALVRLVVPFSPGVAEEDLDGQLQRFVALIEPRLSRYIPD